MTEEPSTFSVVLSLVVLILIGVIVVLYIIPDARTSSEAAAAGEYAKAQFYLLRALVTSSTTYFASRSV